MEKIEMFINKLRSKLLSLVAGVLVFMATPTLHAEEDGLVVHKGALASFKGPEKYFTGEVLVEPLFNETKPSRVSAAVVTFSPGARTAWHTHAVGQHLIVTAGKGRVQIEGGPVEEIVPGDVVWFPPNVNHWHGAAPDSSMSHIAVNESLKGDVVKWGKKVTDTEYQMAANTKTSGSLTITQPNVQNRRLSPTDVESVSPALERYTQERLYGEVWNRPGLSKRDRSLVTISALITRGQVGALSYYFNQAIENGVKPSEISEVITHLAYYAGWGNAFGAVSAAKDVFAKRGIGQDQLPPAFDKLMPLDEAVEAKRKDSVDASYGAVAPGVVQYTTDALFRDLWLRPGLAPRDRSLVTVSALITMGQTSPVSYHLNRAMDNGLTQEQASEALTQLAFYSGWPNVFAAMPVFKEVFESRSK